MTNSQTVPIVVKSWKGNEKAEERRVQSGESEGWVLRIGWKLGRVERRGN